MVTIEHIQEYIDRLRVGQLVDVMVYGITEANARSDKQKRLKAVIKQKFPNIILTNRGTFMNSDIYFWNRGKRF